MQICSTQSGSYIPILIIFSINISLQRSEKQGFEHLWQEPRNDAVIINVKGLNKGLYIVRVITTNGTIEIAKFVKE